MQAASLSGTVVLLRLIASIVQHLYVSQFEIV